MDHIPSQLQYDGIMPYRYLIMFIMYIQILVLRLNEHVSLTVRVVLALLPHLQRSRLARSENTVDHVPPFWHSVHSVLFGLEHSVFGSLVKTGNPGYGGVHGRPRWLYVHRISSAYPSAYFKFAEQ